MKKVRLSEKAPSEQAVNSKFSKSQSKCSKCPKINGHEKLKKEKSVDLESDNNLILQKLLRCKLLCWTFTE